MHPAPTLPPPLVSVIITCYNHGHYLPEALASVWQQAYPALEVVVVDDGSRDNTRAVAEACADRLRYVHQTNQGLAAARNAGVAHSTGQYLVFLDADDWLLPGALACNAELLRQHPELAFVSGGHEKVYERTGEVMPVQYEVPAQHYQRLLQGNYIGMHAAVMYQRWVFEHFAFDPSLPACEDYDLYLRVARHHPVAHHPQRLAAYRQHNANMSGNAALMLRHAQAVLARQLPGLRDEAEAQAYATGRAFWQAYYAPAPASPAPPAPLLSPARFRTLLPRLLKNHSPLWLRRLLHRAQLYPSFVPPVGRVAPGDLLRPDPFSRDFGYDRGGPIDRYYIERFLGQQASFIRGRVLEIGDDSYTRQFGGAAVRQRDVLHVDASNEHATLVGDLSAAPHIADDSFDCLLITQTLHLIYDFRAALDTCYRILRPGGTLLLTVPGLTPIDRGDWRQTWYWSFTDQALRRLLADAFPQGGCEVFSFGNVGVATAYLYGLGLPEVDAGLLDYYDPQFQVINAVRATKYAPLA